jgi:flagellar hook-basal body complex protein FliE
MSIMKIMPGAIKTNALGLGQTKTAEAGTENFGDFLSNALKGVDNLQQEAGEAQDKLVRGDAAELHQVMIAAEKAGLSMDLLLEIRKRLVEAYQEIERMPV